MEPVARRRFGDIEQLKEINRAPSLFCEDGLQVRDFMSRSRGFLNIPDGKSSGAHRGHGYRSSAGHLLAAVAISSELPTILEIDKDLRRPFSLNFRIIIIRLRFRNE